MITEGRGGKRRYKRRKGMKRTAKKWREDKEEVRRVTRREKKERRNEVKREVQRRTPEMKVIVHRRLNGVSNRPVVRQTPFSNLITLFEGLSTGKRRDAELFLAERAE